VPDDYKELNPYPYNLLFNSFNSEFSLLVEFSSYIKTLYFNSYNLNYILYMNRDATL